VPWRRSAGARIRATYSVLGAPSDADAVLLRVVAPDGTESDYSGGQLTRQDVGKYYCDLTLDQEGEWNFRFEFTGPGPSVGASERGVFVEFSDF
jgi:hypothetical protein